MKRLVKIACLLLAAAVGVGAVPKSRELKIALSEDREVIVAVPEVFALLTGQDQDGAIGIKLSNPDESVTIDITFLPDPEGRFAQARGRTELLHERFAEYVDSSTEKGMQFEELEPRLGAGTYCVFTDVNLVGKTQLPRGEYLHLTAGVKSWRGVIAVFRCFSNDTTSAGYRAIFTMLRESVHEKPVPLK
jgi:hypothetical protein